MDEKKLKALGDIQRALGRMEGFSYAVAPELSECFLDAVAIIDDALKEVLEDG